MSFKSLSAAFSFPNIDAASAFALCASTATDTRTSKLSLAIDNGNSAPIVAPFITPVAAFGVRGIPIISPISEHIAASAVSQHGVLVKSPPPQIDLSAAV